MKRHVLIGVAVAFLGMAITSTSAHALAVNPAGADWTSNSLLATPSSVTGISGLTNAYSNILLIGETGPFASSYSTTLNNNGLQFSITYGSGPSIACPTCVLVVRGGILNPSQYLFDIDGWNGTEQITGAAFWPPANQLPRITSVGIYRVDPVGVPEPASLLLLGAGLAGIGMWRRKVSKV